MLAQAGRSAALPHDGAVHGLFRRLVPQYNRFALIRNARRGNIRSAYAEFLFGFLHRFFHDGKLAFKKLFGIVFDPAGLRIVLRKFFVARKQRLRVRII